MRELLLRLIDWYLARLGEHRVANNSHFLEITARVRELAATAVPLIEGMDVKLTKVRGEYKRRQVVAKLSRLFPVDARIDLALAVEVAIRRMRGLF